MKASFNRPTHTPTLIAKLFPFLGRCQMAAYMMTSSGEHVRRLVGSLSHLMWPTFFSNGNNMPTDKIVPPWNVSSFYPRAANVCTMNCRIHSYEIIIARKDKQFYANWVVWSDFFLLAVASCACRWKIDISFPPDEAEFRVGWGTESQKQTLCQQTNFFFVKFVLASGWN